MVTRGSPKPLLRVRVLLPLHQWTLIENVSVCFFAVGHALFSPSVDILWHVISQQDSSPISFVLYIETGFYADDNPELEKTQGYFFVRKKQHACAGKVCRLSAHIRQEMSTAHRMVVLIMLCVSWCCGAVNLFLENILPHLSAARIKKCTASLAIGCGNAVSGPADGVCG